MKDGATRLRTGVPNHRVKLSAIGSRYDIEGLSVRQLKALLVTHYVDYKGCCERSELVERVHRLWKEHARNRELGKYSFLLQVLIALLT